MELWFTEQHAPGVRFSIKVKQHLFTTQSDYQKIDVFDSYEFGRFLTLDGLMMLTEKDEFIYHEMIVHVPMAVNPQIRDVLIIGGGDGGAARELTRYPGVRHIDLVEIDQAVVDVCREYLPSVAGKLDDPRVHLHFEDGLRYIRRKAGAFDLIIVDSTDPFGPGEGLFTREFFGNCQKALREGGILVNQHESPYYDTYAASMKRAHRTIMEFFPVCKVYQAHIPTYPSGHWLFGFASNQPHPTRGLQADAWNALNIRTRYYNTSLHMGCFAMPSYVLDLLEKENG